MVTALPSDHERLPIASSRTVRFVLLNWMGFVTVLSSLVLLLPLHMESHGFGVDEISIVVSAAGIGGVLSADLVGRLADRLGPVRLLQLGVAVALLAVLLIGLVTSFAALVGLHVAVGVATSASRVGAQMVVRQGVPDDRRGRVHGLQGLMTRVFSLVVPIGAGFLWERLDSPPTFGASSALGICLAVAAGTLMVSPSPLRSTAAPSTIAIRNMVSMAAGPVLFTAARAGRMLLLPLVGLALDLSPSRIGLLVGLTAAADVIVAPVSGPLMDAKGRQATILPAFGLMAVGFVLLGAASTGLVVAVAAVVLGLGNGFSAGLLLTLGTDLAPPGNEGAFLGRFGALTDSGRLVGPLLVGFLGQVFGLSIAAFALAAITLLGLSLLHSQVGETRPSTV